MLSVSVYNLSGEEVGKTRLPKNIFGLEVNNDLIYQAINIHLANRRTHLAKTKDRGEVRGGGRKPWRQKGTGRARHGSIRSPLWRGGGVTFGPIAEKVFEKKNNKKAKRKALLMALSSKARDEELFVLEDIKLKEGKTKIMALLLNKILKEKKPNVLVVLSQKDENAVRALKNIPRTKTILANSLNVFDLLSFKYLFLDKQAIKLIEKIYG